MIYYDILKQIECRKKTHVYIININNKFPWKYFHNYMHLRKHINIIYNCGIEV